MTDKRSCSSGIRVVGLFVLGVLFLSALFTLVASPFVHLERWKIFRRCVSISAFLSLVTITTWIERRPLKSYGFSNTRAGLREFVVGISLGCLLLAILFGVILGIGFARMNVTLDHAKLVRTTLGFLPVAVLVGILEELVFRGLVLQQLLRCSRWLAVLASSAAYSLVHVKTRSMDIPMALELTGLFLFGVVLALSYFRTGQLYLAVGLHAALAYGARTNKLLVEFLRPGLSWLTGTNRLVNGVIGWSLLCAAGIVILWWVRPSIQEGGEHHEGR